MSLIATADADGESALVVDLCASLLSDSSWASEVLGALSMELFRLVRWWWILSGSFRSRVATLTVAEIVVVPVCMHDDVVEIEPCSRPPSCREMWSGEAAAEALASFSRISPSWTWSSLVTSRPAK